MSPMIPIPAPLSTGGANSQYEMNPDDYKYLLTLPGNQNCVDCGANKPDWGSPKLGILFCFKCSGAHRGLGTHLSFVRSVTMDSWTEKQIRLMKAGGNQQCNDFLSKYGVRTLTADASPDNVGRHNDVNGGGGGGGSESDPLRSGLSDTASTSTTTTASDSVKELIRTKYDCPAAELYRGVLEARVNGLPEPTELPPPRRRSQEENNQGANRKMRKMEGFGSSPHPQQGQGDGDGDYVDAAARVLQNAVPVAAAASVAVVVWILASQY